MARPDDAEREVPRPAAAADGVDLRETIGAFSGSEDFPIHVAVPDDDALHAFVIDRLT